MATAFYSVPRDLRTRRIPRKRFPGLRVRSFASGGSFDRTFPGPASRSSGDWKVILATDYPDLRLLHYTRHECTFLAAAFGELRGRVHRRVDLPSERLRDGLQNAEHFAVSEAVTPREVFPFRSPGFARLAVDAYALRCATCSRQLQSGLRAVDGLDRTSERLQYTGSVATTATYTLELRVASPVTGGTSHVEIDGVNVTGSIAVPNTGGWDRWTSVFVPGIPISAGPHVFRLVIDTNGGNGYFGNINFMRRTSP